MPHYPPPQAGAEGSITYPTVRFISSLARNPQSLAGKIGAICFVLAAAALAIALARPKKWRIKPSAPSTALTS
ncbi:hypothetical protein ABFY27_10790 [Akkermansia massiliensis]